MKQVRQHVIQGAVALATSGLMLVAFVGLSSADSPGHGHGDGQHGDHAAAQIDAIKHGEDHASQPSPEADHASQPSPEADHADHGSPADKADTHDKQGDRPGWGCGDINHIHVGPPGGGDGFDPCTVHVVTRTRTLVSGSETETVTETETETGTGTATTTQTATSSLTTSGT
ncbi:MAG: hypothetical protein ACYDAG_15080 [Chloroflexota bacterium]